MQQQAELDEKLQQVAELEALRAGISSDFAVTTIWLAAARLDGQPFACGLLPSEMENAGKKAGSSKLMAAERGKSDNSNAYTL